MPDPRPRNRWSSHRHMAVVLVAFAAMAAPCAAFAADRTVEFTNTAPSQGIDLGLPAPKLGVTGTVKFRVDAAGRRALAAEKRKQELLAEADARSDAATDADRRIRAIEELLAEVEDDQAKLEAIIKQRLVEQYKDGEQASLEFLLSGNDLSDLVARGKVLDAQSEQDRRTADEYEITIARVEQYKLVLEELRGINSDQARNLQERADRLDNVLVAANVGHDEAPADAKPAKEKGKGGTWYVMDGAFTAQLFMPSGSSGYTGGSHTPARRATGMQIQQVLANKKIDLDASGYQDVVTGQIDGRLLDAMMLAAQQFGYIKVTSLKSDHGVYTSSGNISHHAYGCAMDIGTIGSTYITPGSQTPGGEVNQAVVFFDRLGAIKADLAPQQVISLFDLGGSTLSMGDHGDHIHVGYSC